MALPFLGLYPVWGRHLGWLPFFSMTPLAWVLFYAPAPESYWKRVRYGFFLGWMTGIVFFGVTLSWIASVAWEGVALLPPFLALYFGCWSCFVVMIIRPLFLKTGFEGKECLGGSLGAVFMSGAAWVGSEWLRGTLFTGFGWNSYGVAFYQQLPLIQIADITGVAGLSFLGLMTSCMMALTIERYRSGRRSRVVVRDLQSQEGSGKEENGEWKTLSMRVVGLEQGGIKRIQWLHADAALVVIIVLAVFFYGAWEICHPVPLQEELSLAAVQGNIPQDHKWDSAFEKEIMATYERETKLAFQEHPDLVIWPEAATPRPLLNERKTFAQVHQLLQEGKCDLLIGSLYYQESPPRDYNAAILLTAVGEPQVYAKMHLVPFGEYIPCRKTFPLFQWIVGDRVLGDFDAGREPQVLELSKKGIKIAPLICFEDTLGSLVRCFALRRAQLLITLTNDGWFGHTVASQQHAMNALFRAVETKLPMVRIANTGVTCVMDRNGRMTQVLRDAQGNTFFEGLLFSTLSLSADPVDTIYTKYGDWFSYLCLAMSMLVFLPSFFKLVRYRRNRRGEEMIFRIRE